MNKARFGDTTPVDFDLLGSSGKLVAVAATHDVYDEHLFVFAAGLSYYFVLSLFPLLVSMASLLGYVPIPHLFEDLLTKSL